MFGQAASNGIEIDQTAAVAATRSADPIPPQVVAAAAERLSAIEWLVVADAARGIDLTLQRSRAFAIVAALYGREAVESGGRLDVIYKLSSAVIRRGAPKAAAELSACRDAGWSEAELRTLLDSLGRRIAFVGDV
ncbi:hypothetical protein [uncultured Hyphomonas sp.]|uniref:hypothetical protein n=1 Tax=uncultured Hyphomonas sp. TaxID=225298 RepID=UPI002AAB46FE|nr:hypothetical protein [uncultured Hyphomonas sp.]